VNVYAERLSGSEEKLICCFKLETYLYKYLHKISDHVERKVLKYENHKLRERKVIRFSFRVFVCACPL
jgi:hypothetical protein